MGEYATIQGQDVKLGTCDDWRYVRRDEAERWGPVATEGGDGIRWALAEESILWRFPYPWEDGGQAADLHERVMHRPAVIVTIPGGPGTVEHQRFTVAVHPDGGGFNVNVHVPCPYTLGNKPGREPASDLEIKYCSAVPDAMYAEIWAERHGGERGHRTVFKCIYCGHPFCLTPNEAREVVPMVDEKLAAGIVERVRGHA